MKTSGNETSKLAAQTRDKSSSSGENFVFEVTVTSPRQRLSPEKVIDQVFLQVDEKSEQFSMRFNACFSGGVGGCTCLGGVSDEVPPRRGNRPVSRAPAASDGAEGEPRGK